MFFRTRAIGHHTRNANAGLELDEPLDHGRKRSGQTVCIGDQQHGRV